MLKAGGRIEVVWERTFSSLVMVELFDTTVEISNSTMMMSVKSPITLSLRIFCLLGISLLPKLCLIYCAPMMIAIYTYRALLSEH